LEAAEMAAAAPAIGGSIDLARERFLLYVPRTPAQTGYRLLVFVPPWDGAQFPTGWAAVLEREHTIFVSAIESGNDTSIFGRREPLAIIAAENVMHQFHVDRDRVYVAGFSGGSRVALRIALGYPDLFRGVLLNAGSDPIGDAQAPLPPVELFQTFQQSTQLAYVTGEDDQVNIELDAESRLSMLHWCVFNLNTLTMFHTGHMVADSSSLGQALDTLMRNGPPADERKLAQCREHIEGELAAQLAQLLALLHQNQLDAARELLGRIDTRYGGLAAPKSIDLARQIAAGH
jgi:pimeloyl-ACP methyl ester carboxylesterase